MFVCWGSRSGTERNVKEIAPVQSIDIYLLGIFLSGNQ